MGSELDKETFETGKQNSTADTWSESNRDKSLSSFQECQLNSLPASTSNALSSPYEKKPKSPKNMCRQINILTLGFYGGRAFDGNYLGVRQRLQLHIQQEGRDGDLQLCSAQSSGPARPEGILISLGVQWGHRFSVSLVAAPFCTWDKLGNWRSKARLVSE